MAMKGTNSFRKILVIATVNFYKNNSIFGKYLYSSSDFLFDFVLQWSLPTIFTDLYPFHEELVLYIFCLRIYLSFGWFMTIRNYSFLFRNSCILVYGNFILLSVLWDSKYLVANEIMGSLLVCFFFFAVPCSMQDLSSTPRDWTPASCSGSAES